jgi:hydroxyacylglutathione hydrolase
VFFRQFVDSDLGCASYLVGEGGEAVVVDPAYAIEQYLGAGPRLVAVLETHTHADHVSGHGRLALEHGLPVHIHPAAEPEYPYLPLADGQELRVGGVTVRVIHTPGHRPEHCALLVGGSVVLTGDSLFVGDAARPDLAVAAREGAEGLFHSLRRLAELPPDVAVYPGHVAGSLCGVAMSPRTSTTVGEERRENRALRYAALEDFVAASLAISTPRPPNMERIVELNRGPFVGAAPQLESLEEQGGATVLDVRTPEEFAAGHVPGALNVPVSGTSFATKAAFMLRPDEDVALCASSHVEAERAARGLRSVGFLELAGYLEHPALTEGLEPIGVPEAERLLADDAAVLLDVREKDERDAGYIAGSRHLPYRLTRACADDLRDGGRPVVTICESGARAAIAASALAAAGIEARPVLHGGIEDWPGGTVHFRRCGGSG